MAAGPTVITRRSFNVNKRRLFVCRECPSAFGSRMELEEHTNSHTGRRPFVCKVCHCSFNRRSTLWNHKRIHGNEKPFRCPICFATFKWKNSLKCHGLMHTRKQEAQIDQFEAKGQTFRSGKRRATRQLKEADQPKNKRTKRNADDNDKTTKQEPINKSWKLPGMASFLDIPSSSPMPPTEDLIWAFGDRCFYGQSSFLTRSMEPIAQPSNCIALPTVCLPADHYFTDCNNNGDVLSDVNDEDSKRPDKSLNVDYYREMSNHKLECWYPQGMFYEECRFVPNDYIMSGSPIDSGKVLPCEEW